VRGTASVTWDYQAWSVLTRYNYTGKWFVGDPINGCFVSAATVAIIGNCDVAAFGTVDMGATFTGIKDTTLTLLVRNIAGRDAPFDSQQPTLGFNPTFHSPQGVNYVLTAAYRFK
jgi:outer membrane receptor protein involved in Fe transport